MKGFVSALGLALWASTLAPLTVAKAATFTPIFDQSGNPAIRMTGEILPDDIDAKNLASLYSQMAGQGRTPKFLFLDSPGGNIMGAVAINSRLTTFPMGTLVESNATCASACVLIFGAGSSRWAYYGAKIGVHSASNGGASDGAKPVEDKDALAMTMIMARVLSDSYHAPMEVIGKLVTTKAGDLAWLNENDLKLWGVKMLGAPVLAYNGPPATQPAPTYVQPPAPTYVPPPPVYVPPPQTVYVPPQPVDPRTPAQKIFDYVLATEGTPMSSFSEFAGNDWSGKVEYMKSIGARFTKDCGQGTCKYRGDVWSRNGQVLYYLQSIGGERVYCVKNYRTGNGACANQDTNEVLYLRKTANADQWLKA